MVITTGLDTVIDFGIPGEAQHDLVEDVFKYKVLVVVGGSQLDVLEDELVHYHVHVPDGCFEVVPMRQMLRGVIE